VKRLGRPTLLMLTAIAATLSTVANGVGVVDAMKAPEPTRLGVALDRDAAAQDALAGQRARKLDMREQAARATEQRLKTDLAARAAAATAKGADADAGEQYDSLARIYQAMKPARAAVVFEQLDMDVQMQVARRMRDRSTGMVMAAMTPRGAAALSMALARKSARAAPAAARPVAAGPAAAAPAVVSVKPVAPPATASVPG
jgi:flagellar motility protein MotE (MotC chaperone)